MDSLGRQIQGGTTGVRRLGKYQLVARIGEGGMAEVHLAHMRGPRNFRKVVVVKTIHPDLASQEQFLEMLLDEARLSALIKHPRVVDIYDLGHADGTYFIAMEYLDGQPLSAVMTAGVRGNALDPYSMARIIADAAEGLHAAHELTTMTGKSIELVHRDVSPGNIIVLYDGNVKIVDFGIAKARGRLQQSGARQLKGKLGYMSPEQLCGEAVDRRSDVFSLGVVFWEVLALQRLFSESSPDDILERVRKGDIQRPSTLRPQVPPQLDDICLRALAADPVRRYQTGVQFKQAIDWVLREAGYYRESDAISKYMEQVFAKRRAERNQLLRMRGNTSSEMDALADADGPHTEDMIAPTPRIPGGTPTAGVTAAPAAPAVQKKAARWPLAAALGGALAIAVAGVVALSGSGGGKKGAGEPARPAADVALAPLPAPAMVPAPVPAPTPAAAASADAPPAPSDEATPPPSKAAKEKSAAALYEEGTSLFVQGKADKAKDKFKGAIAVDGHHAASYRGLGLAYQSLGKNDKAVSAFEKYLRLKPGAPDAASIRARIDKLKQ